MVDGRRGVSIMREGISYCLWEEVIPPMREGVCGQGIWVGEEVGWGVRPRQCCILWAEVCYVEDAAVPGSRSASRLLANHRLNKLTRGKSPCENTRAQVLYSSNLLNNTR